MATALVRNRRLIDHEFAFLASRAAIGIDDLMAGVPTETGAVAELSGLLNDDINDGLSDSKALSFAAPGAIEVFSKAVAQAENKTPITIADLVAEANAIVKKLQATTSDQSADELAELRNFCAALSIAASDYLARHARSGPPQPHKY